MAKPITITIPPFRTEDGDYPAFWAWVAIVLTFILIGLMEFL